MRPLWVVPLAILCVAGCGGGGASGGGDCTTSSVRSSFNYTTEWTTGGIGDSQVITLFDANGNSVGSRVLNRSAGETTFSLPSLGSGTYRLLAVLFSAPDGAGTELGRVETPITLCRATSFATRTGRSATTLRVIPNPATTVENRAIRFAAYPEFSGGVAEFVSPGSLDWTALGSIGTIDSTGNFIPSADGSGTIRARITSRSMVTNAPLTVTPFTPTTSKWTVLVYMNAANDLFSFSTLNMNQMETIAGNPDVRFVVQWKQARDLFPTSSFDGTRRVLVRPDNSNQVVSEVLQDMGSGVDMGDPDTLNEFIDWAKAFYPSNRTVLIVWNHGNGWLRSPLSAHSRGVSYDDETGNSIQTWELAQALNGHRFDILSWDSSLMQMLEVAYEVRNFADYVVGSEESPPGEGLPYQLVFSRFRDNPDDTTRNLSKAFVDGMLGNSAYASRKITQSSVETARLGALATAVDTLAAELIAAGSSVNTLIPAIRASAQSYSPTATRVYRDLGHVCDLLIANGSTPTAVRNAAQQVKTTYTAAIAWEGNNANSPNSSGLSIDFASASTHAPFGPDYGQLDFAQDTRWDTWLSQAP